jgi:hypothetical protein
VLTSATTSLVAGAFWSETLASTKINLFNYDHGDLHATEAENPESQSHPKTPCTISDRISVNDMKYKMRLSVFALLSFSLGVKGEEPAPSPVELPTWDANRTPAPSPAFLGNEPTLDEPGISTEAPSATLVFGGPVDTPTWGGGEAPSPAFFGGGEPQWNDNPVTTEAPSAVLVFSAPVVTPTWGGEAASNPNDAPPTDEDVPTGTEEPTHDDIPTDEPPNNEFVPTGTEEPTHDDIPVDESPVDVEVPSGTEEPTHDDVPVDEEVPTSTLEPTDEPTRDDVTLKPIVSRYTESPTDTPQAYVTTDDDPLQRLDPSTDINDGSSWEWKDSQLEDMEHDRTVLVALLSVLGVGIFLSVFVAHQMIQNPRGCCARCVYCHQSRRFGIPKQFSHESRTHVSSCPQSQTLSCVRWLHVLLYSVYLVSMRMVL